MKHLLLIILISLLLLSSLLTSCVKNGYSPVIGNSNKGETLYRWGECILKPVITDIKCDYEWMGYGDIETHPVYKGQVKDGKPNGLGFMTYPNGFWLSKYVGEYKDGKRNGQGTETMSNGRKNIGEWKDGKSWNITYYDKDGNIKRKYVNGKRIKQ